MKTYEIEDNEAIIVLGPERFTVYAPMMEGDVEIPATGIPDHVQFATALVFLSKTDPDFRAWVTEKWHNLVEEFMVADAEGEETDEV